MLLLLARGTVVAQALLLQLSSTEAPYMMAIL